MNTMSTEELKSFPKWFVEHPITANILKQQSEQIYEARHSAIKELSRIEKAESKAFSRLNGELESALSALAEWRTKETGFVAAVRKVEIAIDDAKHDFYLARKPHLAILSSTIDPAIMEAQAFFHERFQQLRASSNVLVSEQAGTKDLVTLRQKIYVTSNMKYIAEAAEYCRKASEELEAMKLESICDHERIQQLKQNIPGFKQVDFREKEIPLKDFTEIAFREREGSSLLHRPL